jgi:phage terminase small subunit
MGDNTPPIEAKAFAVLLDGIAPAVELRTAYDQLKPTERLFVDEYVASDDPRGAAIRSAGMRDQQKISRPSVADVRALELMKRPLVQAAIAERMKAAMDRLSISADNVLQEVAKLAFANMGDYVRITPDGEPYTDLSNVSRDMLAAVSEVSTEDYMEGRGEDARAIRKVKFKLHDKGSALDKLMRYHGLYAPDKVELTGKNGAPIQTRNVNVDMTAAEASEIYRQSLEQST